MAGREYYVKRRIGKRGKSFFARRVLGKKRALGKRGRSPMPRVAGWGTLSPALGKGRGRSGARVERRLRRGTGKEGRKKRTQRSTRVVKSGGN